MTRPRIRQFDGCVNIQPGHKFTRRHRSHRAFHSLSLEARWYTQISRRILCDVFFRATIHIQCILYVREYLDCRGRLIIKGLN